MLAPFSVAADSSGNIYVAEFGTNRIRKIDTKGNITTAIGDGNQGFAGDGGPPNKVEMTLPTGVAVDSSGNVFFADSLNNRIRKLAGGSVNTIAGNGLLSLSGDGGHGYQSADQCAAGRRGGFRRQPVHRRYGEQHGAASGQQRRDLHLRGHRHRRVVRRWQRGHQRPTQRSARAGGGFRGQSLYRRYAEPSRAQGDGRHHFDGRRQRHRGLRRRRRCSRQRAAQPAFRGGGGCGRQSVYRRIRQ